MIFHLEKIKMMKKTLIAILFVFASICTLSAQDCIPSKQNPPKLVNDFANALSPGFEAQLERYLIGFNDTTSTQIALVTVNDLCGEEASFFAFELGEKWGVGDKDFDNGIVVLYKPKQTNSKGQVFIATGYGLEGILPDATTKMIVENEMIPDFKNGRIERGLLQGIQTIVEITGGEYSANNYNSKGRGGKKGSALPVLFIFIFIIIMFFGTFSRAKGYASRNNTSLWMALMLMGSASNRHSGSFGNFSGGRGGFGGGSGGGFGGFGGGSFGGGGAGGSW